MVMPRYQITMVAALVADIAAWMDVFLRCLLSTWELGMDSGHVRVI